MSNRANGKPLWWVRPIVDDVTQDEAGAHFVGSEAEMVEHINRLHRETGTQHAATNF